MNLKEEKYAYFYGLLLADGHLSEQTRNRERSQVLINALKYESCDFFIKKDSALKLLKLTR